jgi:hypothetical protein
MPSTPHRPPSDGKSPRPNPGDSTQRARKVYEPPRLEVLGDVREITLGGTIGVGDSGFPNTQPF